MRTKKRIPLYLHDDLFVELQEIVKKNDLKSVSGLINEIISKSDKPAIKPRKRHDITIDISVNDKLASIAKSYFSGNSSEAANYLISDYLEKTS